MPSENGIGAILKNCTKIWAPLLISGVRCLNLSCGKKRSWHIMCRWYHDVVIDREKERSHCIKKNLNMPPRSQKKGPRLPCTCTVCRGAVMSARTVHLHNSRPRYNPTLGSGSSYQIGSCQPIFGSLINSTTLQGTNPMASPLTKNPIPTAATQIWMPTVPKCKVHSRGQGPGFRMENSQ